MKYIKFFLLERHEKKIVLEFDAFSYIYKGLVKVINLFRIVNPQSSAMSNFGLFDFLHIII